VRTAWGKWTFDPEVKVLRHHDAPTYEVDVEDMRTSAEMLDWIFQLHGKSWVTHQDLGDLVEALWYLIDPQATLCSDGHEQGPNDFDSCYGRTKAMREIQDKIEWHNP
jgi:hypothetical protein